MATYFVGDVQGCDEALVRLLEEIGFSPSRDGLFLLGDLVNRGPDSLGVLRRVQSMQGSARCVLGNHDLHLLATACGARPPGRRDTLETVLQAPDRAALVDWLRQQPLALWADGALLVHAGVLPQWTVDDTLSLASEVQQALQQPGWSDFMRDMYGNTPSVWHDGLAGAARLRVIVNALTRLRFCSASGEMEFETKESAASAPAGYVPWFNVPGRRTEGVTIAFGHWSTLGSTGREDALALDSGCVWGGCLTALRWHRDSPKRVRLTVRCAAAQQPGR